jgi:drug/metabolite transporter (DMT)-like permease
MSSLVSRNNLIGIGSLILGIFVFSIQDTIIKSISGNNAVTLAIYIRSIVALPILLAIVHFDTGLRAIWTPHAPWLLLRGTILLMAYLSYYMALPALPLAEAIALFFLAPLMVTIMSVPMLGEKVGAAAWIAVIIGLAGAFTIAQPGSALFEPASLLSLGSAVAYAFAMVWARRRASGVATGVMSFYQNVSYLMLAPAMGLLTSFNLFPEPSHPSLKFLLRPWEWPNTHDMLLLGSCGVIAAIAATLLTHAYRKGQASIVAPFEYTGMIWGAVWGLVLFSEIPKQTTLIGMALIAVSGMIALRAGQKA